MVPPRGVAVKTSIGLSATRAATSMIKSTDSEDAEEESEETVSQSQSQGSANITKLVADMVKTTRNRRAAKRRQIERRWEEAAEIARKNLDKLHAEHQAQLARLRRKQLERLGRLIQEKEKVESSIIQSLHTMGKAYATANEALSTIMRVKVQDLGSEA